MCFHMIGFYALYLTKQTNINKSQRIFLMNLSLAEIFLCFTAVLKSVFLQSGYMVVALQCRILQMTVSSLAYYLLMIFLTIDRFSEVYLNIRYPLYWSKQRATWCMLTIWILGVVFLCITLIQQPTNKQLSYIFHLYVYPALEYIFCVVAFCTYGYIYKVLHWGTLQNTVDVKSQQTNRCERRRRKRKIGFFMPSMLILTFILFVLIPEQTHFYYFVLRKKMPEIMEPIFVVAFSLAFLSDAVIYIFFCAHVRHVLLLKFRRLRLNKTPNSRRQHLTMETLRMSSRI